jgi:hypothetical protein
LPFEDALADVLAPWVEDSAWTFSDATAAFASASKVGDGVDDSVKSTESLRTSFFGHEEGFYSSDASVTLDENRCSSARRVRKPRLAVQQT